MGREDVILFMERDALRPLRRSTYDSEDLLQQWLVDHHGLLAGEQIRPGDPVRWLLVTREAAVPDRAEGSGRWSLDHLFLDQDGRPTFVEVKRSSDTRIRREVVGQMLDYAANATAYWPAERIRQLATEQHGGEEGLAARLRELLAGPLGDEGGDPLESYWHRVAEHMRLGRVRLLFVADAIPADLLRVIEFMNEHMNQIEVLGVEVAQYADGDRRAFVPRVVGFSEQARLRKEPSAAAPRRRTTEDVFFSSCPEITRPFFLDLLTEANRRELTVEWGTKGFSVRVERDGQMLSVFYGYPAGVNGRASPYVQGYLGNLPADLRGWVAETFQGAAPFERRGDHTLDLVVDERALPLAGKVYDAVWAIADRLRRERIVSGDSGP